MPKTTTTKKTKTSEEKVSTPAVATAPKGRYFYANGKRKTSVARVKVYKGTGSITVNDKPANEYFPVKSFVGAVKSPLILTGSKDKFDITARILGGGLSSQAEALRHGISKALIEADPLNKPTLKKAGFLTRDSRVKERKKYGLKRARKGPQFSKR